MVERFGFPPCRFESCPQDHFKMNPPIKKEVPQLWGIEICEAGVWNDYMYEENLKDALTMASLMVNSVREEYVRIVTPDNKII